MLSSSINENDMRESYAKGATQYWRKPVDFNEFLEVIQQLKPSWLGPEHSQPDAAD